MFTTSHRNRREALREVIEPMTKRTYRASAACAIAAALLTGCGGGGGSTPPAPATPSGSHTANVSMTFHFNNQSSQSALRGRKYTSRATHGLSVSWEQSTQDGVAHFPVSPNVAQAMRTGSTFVTAITPGTVTNNMTCGAADGSGAFSCSILMPVTTGYTDFRIATWDQAPATLGANNDGFGGTFAGSANDLSTNVLMTYRVNANQTNDFNFTTNGVVRSVALAVNPNSMVSGGNAETATLSVLAKDADGNIIIGNDPYVDDNGSPVTITVNRGTETYPVPLTGPAAPANGNVTFAASANCATAIQCTISNPTVQSLTIDYNAYETAASAFTASAASTGTSIATTGATLQFTNSTDSPVNVPGSPTMANLTLGAPSAFHDVVAGINGDTNLYATDYGNEAIVQMAVSASTAPTITHSWDLPSKGTGSPETLAAGLVQGPDQNIYFAENATGKLGVLNVATNQFSETSGFAGPYAMAFGPDNNLYVANRANNTLVEVQVAGIAFNTAANTYPVIASAQAFSTAPQAVIKGASATSMYAVEVNRVVRVSLPLNPAPGHQNESSPVSGANFVGGAVGADGYLYVTDAGNNKIVQFNISGGTPAPTGASWSTTYAPQDISLAQDGNLYFTEWGNSSNGSPNVVGRLSVGAPSQPAEFTNGVLTSTSLGSSQPNSIVQGSDGRIYFTYLQAQDLGYFAP